MSAVATEDLGKRYGRRWALRNCTLEIPEGRVVGLVGANGAGKTTLLHLAVGLIVPTEGSITTCGDRPGASADHLARVGFLALSPDGRQLAFVAYSEGQRAVWLRPLNSLEAQRLAGTPSSGRRIVVTWLSLLTES